MANTHLTNILFNSLGLPDTLLQGITDAGFHQWFQIFEELVDAEAALTGHGFNCFALAFTIDHERRPHEFFRAGQGIIII